MPKGEKYPTLKQDVEAIVLGDRTLTAIQIREILFYSFGYTNVPTPEHINTLLKNLGIDRTPSFRRGRVECRRYPKLEADLQQIIDRTTNKTLPAIQEALRHLGYDPLPSGRSLYEKMRLLKRRKSRPTLDHDIVDCVVSNKTTIDEIQEALRHLGYDPIPSRTTIDRRLAVLGEKEKLYSNLSQDIIDCLAAGETAPSKIQKTLQRLGYDRIPTRKTISQRIKLLRESSFIVGNRPQ